MPERPGGGILDEDSLREDALDYHSSKPAGKITVVPTKPHGTQRELSLAYSPGVAYPCKEIENNPDPLEIMNKHMNRRHVKTLKEKANLTLLKEYAALNVDSRQTVLLN